MREETRKGYAEDKGIAPRAGINAQAAAQTPAPENTSCPTANMNIHLARVELATFSVRG